MQARRGLTAVRIHVRSRRASSVLPPAPLVSVRGSCCTSARGPRLRFSSDGIFHLYVGIDHPSTSRDPVRGRARHPRAGESRGASENGRARSLSICDRGMDLHPAGRRERSRSSSWKVSWSSARRSTSYNLLDQFWVGIRGAVRRCTWLSRAFPRPARVVLGSTPARDPRITVVVKGPTDSASSTIAHTSSRWRYRRRRAGW